MKAGSVVLRCVVILGCIMTRSALAHHSAVAYDTTQSVTLTGTVVEWLWANPHCSLSFDVKDPSGKVQRWSAETVPPADLLSRGWSRKMFQPGDTVTVSMNPGRHGEPIGRINTVTVNGKTFGGAVPGANRGGGAPGGDGGMAAN